jgi:sugar/nucleoside kinase (ribokinase family)
MSTPAIMTLGVHVLDVHVRPIESIPEGSEGQIVDQIRVSPAGTAGGTAVVLAKLGASVRTAGAIGKDALGRTLVELLTEHGIDVTGLVAKDAEQTSASVLPIRPNGDRPAWHCIGANALFAVGDVDLDRVAASDHVHLGGVEFLGGEAAAQILSHARAHGVSTSVDLLAPCDPGMLEWIAAALPHVDYFMPNDEQLRGFTGLDDLVEAAEVMLSKGVSCVAVTAGADGAVVVSSRGAVKVPAYDVAVVDTTGCGDAFSAGFIRATCDGKDVEEAARIGCATSAHVAQGLATDFGDYDYVTVLRFSESAPTL